MHTIISDSAWLCSSHAPFTKAVTAATKTVSRATPIRSTRAIAIPMTVQFVATLIVSMVATVDSALPIILHISDYSMK